MPYLAFPPLVSFFSSEVLLYRRQQLASFSLSCEFGEPKVIFVTDYYKFNIKNIINSF